MNPVLTLVEILVVVDLHASFPTTNPEGNYLTGAIWDWGTNGILRFYYGTSATNPYGSAPMVYAATMDWIANGGVPITIDENTVLPNLYEIEVDDETNP